MNRIINITAKWTAVVLGTVLLLGACNKDEELGWLSFDSNALFVEGLGRTTTMGFATDGIRSVQVITVPDGWKAEIDMSSRTVSVTAPNALGGDTGAVRSGNVVFSVSTDANRAFTQKLFVGVSDHVNLASARSNCLILSQPYSNYEIDVTHKGESDVAFMPASVAVIWQTAPNLVRFPVFRDGRMRLYVDADDQGQMPEGNALLGAYDSEGKLLWSWHLWLVSADRVQEQIYANGKTFMSLNLGAHGVTNATREEILASFGMFYQWGRKEPFVGPDAYNAADATDAYIYNIEGGRLQIAYEASTPNTGTATYAAEHPLSFILGVEKSSYDWLYGARSDARWGAPKTLDDPCPKGWRVPLESEMQGLSIVDKLAGREESFGWELTDGAVTTFYPGAGFRPYLTGRIQNVYNPLTGVDVPKPWVGYYWSSDAAAEHASALFFWLDAADASRSGIELGGHYRSNGMQLRCVKE